MGIQPKDKPVVVSSENYNKKSVFKFSFVNPRILGLLTVVLLMVVGVGTGVYYINQTPKQTIVTQASLDKSDISFQPSEVQTKSGSEFSIDVFANANKNQITSAQLAIKFDGNTLELLNISPKQFLPKVLFTPEISSGSASISLGSDGNAGISGSGILATLSFRAKNPGASQITFAEGTRIDVLGNTTSPLSELKSANVIISSALNQAESGSTPSGTLQDTETPDASGDPTEVSFDFNSDSQVNSIDLSVLYSAWGTPSTDLQKKADVNADGVVNGIDYANFLPNMKR